MATIDIKDAKGEKTGTAELNPSVFGIEPNAAVMHAAVVNYLANQRQGTQSTLTRAEVRGGGIKPWRQKAPAAPVRVLSALRSGPTAVLPSARSRVPTTIA